VEFVQDGSCAEEKQARGELGPISDNELLVRVVRSPQHLNLKTGVLRPGLFPRSDISSKGLSLTRSEKLLHDELLVYARAVAELKSGEKLHGLRCATAASLREVKLRDGVRALCVIEDPAAGIDKVPDNPAHSVTVASQKSLSEDEIIEIQVKLAKIFRDYGLEK
jgi:hypothetical protein